MLYLYGNYGGDVYTFDLAADLSSADDVRTTTVVGTDDILSAPTEKASTRRGVAGLFFAYKTAGASAERGDDLATVTEIAQRTVDRTRTMGVGLSPRSSRQPANRRSPSTRGRWRSGSASMANPGTIAVR
nr:dihydroxyacetone kinase subunit DhaK [Brachybacterium sp. Z12]